MKFQFEANQDYQLEAIDAVVDIFAGQPVDTESVILPGQSELALDGQQLSLENASTQGNELLITNDQLLKNTWDVQAKYKLPQSQPLLTHLEAPTNEFAFAPTNAPGQTLAEGSNFTIEMETGTGKTYVYLRTIHELRAKYGFKKFIIVVPSVAIKEGVLKNLEITKEHFASLYDNPEMNYYVWDPKKRGQARQFATTDTLQIMVVTIDSFARSQNIMRQASDYGTPIDFIKATNPIVIVDEPQNMETPIRKAAIEELNPLCTLRYSATHKQTYNLLYKLDPVKAYDLGLVKKIEVDSIYSEDAFNSAYIRLIKIENKGKSGLVAHIEVDKDDTRGLQKKIEKLQPGDNLELKTNRSVYEGYILDSIDAEEKCIEFANGKIFYIGQRDEGLHDEILKYQIERTIENHFEKERKYAGQGVKILSLFFIDKVNNYRNYTENGFTKGKFAVWFEQAYAKIAAKPKYRELATFNATEVHNGYFAKDKHGNWKDSADTKGEGGKTSDDDTAYSLIMQDKEKLLDLTRPLRFIFSHSALREGWDNPNVFQICTLNETSSELKKRQEIGRGLRLPVNNNGVRIRDEQVNILTVVANESYEEFAGKLQREIEDETGVSFAGRIKDKSKRTRIKLKKNIELDPSFKELWAQIKHQTKYSVAFDTEKIIENTTKLLEYATIAKPRISNTRTRIEKMGEGNSFVAEVKSSDYYRDSGEIQFAIPDVIGKVQEHTKLTRKTIFDILEKSGMISKMLVNPQQVIDEVTKAVNQAMQILMVDGISYVRTGKVWDMSLFDKDFEIYVENLYQVQKQEKTLYDYVAVDSKIEYTYAAQLEQNDDIKFYFKLPGWFKIETPLGKYNPDWAVVLERDKRVYFISETKGVDDITDVHLSDSERLRIAAGKKHFDTLDVAYIGPVSTLNQTLQELTNKEENVQ